MIKEKLELYINKLNWYLTPVPSETKQHELMKTRDTYGEFKEWYYNSHYSSYLGLSDLFEEFEETIKEKNNEREIKQIITDALSNNNHDENEVDMIYMKLKEEGRLK